MQIQLFLKPLYVRHTWYMEGTADNWCYHPAMAKDCHKWMPHPCIVPRWANCRCLEYGPCELRLERFLEAVYDPLTKIWYHALTGTRKQSVSDVEQIFSSKTLESKGYAIEATYVHLLVFIPEKIRPRLAANAFTKSGVPTTPGEKLVEGMW